MNPTPTAEPRRRRLLPGWRSVAWVVLFAMIAALLFRPLARNTYIELFGEALFVGLVLLAAFTAAGASKQTVIPRWAAQLLAVTFSAPLGPLVVQLLTARGDFLAFLKSTPHVRGFVLVTVGALLMGTMVALGAILREREAQARATVLRAQLEGEVLER